MRVLMVHNYYQQPGGEDRVFESEADLLESYGHHVVRYTVHNDAVDTIGPLRAAARAVWSRPAQRALRALVTETRPDIAHFHNTFPLVSPAGYVTVRSTGVPVVQTIHNYRWLCPSALFYRDGHVCEDCLDKRVAWPGIVHACYRESRAATATVAAMQTVHRLRRTLTADVDVFVTLTDFMRDKLIEGGFPAKKIVVKPNAVSPDPGIGTHMGGFALFAGRLTHEKGIPTLLDAWRQLPDPPPLRIAGDGPLADMVARRAEESPAITWLGRQPKEAIDALMRDAKLIIVPSEWYEGAPMVIGEAFAAGAVVLGSDIGGIASMIEHQRTGLLFQPGDSANLAHWVTWAMAHHEEVASIGHAARHEFETRYTPERNYAQLMAVYERAGVAERGGPAMPARG